MWRQEGEARAMSMAIVLLTNKLGALPEDLKEPISKADVPTLELILMNIFTTEYIDEVKKYVN